MGDYIIELKNISKCYEGDTAAVDNVSLSIAKGEFVTLLGPSGCGKTTILRMIGGFELPTSGQILLGGKDISKLPPNERPINTVFQKYALFPYLNIYDNIAFGLKLKKLPKDVIDEKVRHVLDVVDLEGFERRRVHTLSGGQQQRVAIARAIVNEPEILLLDEPLGALDYKMRKEMQLELKLMHEQLGITFIFVTHDQEEALTMSDKIVVMSNGEIQQVGTPEEIYDELVQVMKEEKKICNYLDLPIQHASDRILKRMGRRTTRKQLEDIIAKLRREIPDIVLRTSLITGFPGETQEDHEELMEFVDEMEFDRLGVFTYSPEEGTPAETMEGQVPEEVKEERRDELMSLQQEISLEKGDERIGQELVVMIEGKVSGESAYIARTYADAPKVDGYIFVQTGELLVTGDFARVRVTGALEYDLIGELADEYTE